jgi:bifunctional oxygenase/reductase
VHYAENQTAADETVTLIEKDGGHAFAVQARLGVPGDVDELFLGVERGLREWTGATTLDILVNNAAEIAPSGIAPEDVTPEQFDRFFAVNTKAPFFLVQRALPCSLKAAGSSTSAPARLESPNPARCCTP